MENEKELNNQILMNLVSKIKDYNYYFSNTDIKLSALEGMVEAIHFNFIRWLFAEKPKHYVSIANFFHEEKPTDRKTVEFIEQFVLAIRDMQKGVSN